MMSAGSSVAGRAPLADGHRREEGARPKLRGGSLRNIASLAEHFAGTGFLKGKSWSLAQVCEHLALSLENTVRGSKAEGLPLRWQRLSRFQRLVRWSLKNMMLLTGYFPKGAPAPESVQPPKDASIDSALDRLRRAATAFDDKYASRRATWAYHSLLGRMTGRMWRRFHFIHAAHHFSFLHATSHD